jgi:RHS repeat-associated protein
MRRSIPVGTKAPKRRAVTWPAVVLVGALILAVLQAPLRTSLEPGGHGANIALATVSGTFSQYSPGELWGGGAPDERCLSCTAADLVGSDTAQSIQDGTQVDPATGDFTTSQTLFSVPTPDGSLEMSMTYDSQRSISEALDPSAYPYSNPGPLGWGWQSSLNVSLYASSTGAVQVNEGNGSEIVFNPLGNQSGQIPSNGCPVGDDQDYQKYTVTGSSTAFCAPERVDAQMGTGLLGESYQYNEEGGKADELFNYYGQLVDQGTPEDPYGVSYAYNATPGQGNCPSDGEAQCSFETQDGSTRDVEAQENSSGLVTAIYDPAGRLYTFGYTDGRQDLNQVTDDSADTTSYGYSTSNQNGDYNHEMTSITDPDGGQHAEQIIYGDVGMVTQTSDAFGNTTNYSYVNTNCGTLTGCLTTGNPPAAVQQTTTVTYPNKEDDLDQYTGGLLVADCYGPSVTCSGDLDWSFNYNFPSANGLEQTTTEYVAMPSGPTPTIITDGAGEIVQYTDPAGNTTNYMYNDNGHNDFDSLCWSAAPGLSIPSNASCTNPPPGSTYYAYDSYGNELSKTDPLGNTTRDGYYVNGLTCWTAPPMVTAAGSACSNSGSSPTGAPTGSTADTYDAQGDLTGETVAYGTSVADTTTKSYDLDDDLLYSIPPDGQGQGSTCGVTSYVTCYAYYANGRTETVTAPLGRQTGYTYDPAGNVLTETDPAGVTTTTYDPDNRSCWTYRGASAVGGATCTPGAAGPAGSTSYTTYNGDSDAPSVVYDPDGNKTTSQYNDYAYPTKATDIADPMGTEPTFAVYDNFGNTCVSGPGNPVAPPACPTTATAIAGDTTDLYNSEGQLQATYDPNGYETTYSYARADFPLQPTSEITPTGRTIDGYDLDGNQNWFQDPEGNNLSTGYDADGRPCWQATGQNLGATCSVPPQGTGASTYAYDAAGNRIQMVDNNGNTSAPVTVTDTYSYDADGNLTSARNDNGSTVGYSYDAAAEATCIAYPIVLGGHASTCTAGPGVTNAVVDRAYDGDGRLASTKDWLGNTETYTGYNPNSQLGTITYPSSTNESLTYGYDSAKNLTSAAYSGPVVGPTTESWAPNADEQLATTTNQLGGFSSPIDTYNSYKQVASDTNPTSPTTSATDTYTYQPDGRISTDTPTGGSTITYGYNSQLELTSVTNPNSTNTALAYNGDGQRCASITGTTQPSCSTSGATLYGWNKYGQLTSSGTTSATTTYTYDGNGLRMSDTTGSSTSDFTWDTADGGGTPLDIDDGTYAYIYGPTLFGGTAPIEQIKLSTSTAQFLSSTPSGVQTVFSSAGALQEEAAYSSYGSQFLSTGPSQSNFGFQGSYTDSSSKLIYLINRYYDPATAQFLSVDPDVAETGQPYAFTADDPLNATDPLGLNPCAFHRCGFFGPKQTNKRHAATCRRSPSACRGSVQTAFHGAISHLDSIRRYLASVHQTGNADTDSLPVIGPANSWVNSHPRQTAAVGLGTLSLMTLQPEGVDASASLYGGLTVSQYAGAGAALADAPSCAGDETVSNCGPVLAGGGIFLAPAGAALAGGYSLITDIDKAFSGG